MKKGLLLLLGTATSFGIRVNEIIRKKLPWGGEDCTYQERIDKDIFDWSIVKSL